MLWSQFLLTSSPLADPHHLTPRSIDHLITCSPDHLITCSPDHKFTSSPTLYLNKLYHQFLITPTKYSPWVEAQPVRQIVHTYHNQYCFKQNYTGSVMNSLNKKYLQVHLSLGFLTSNNTLSNVYSAKLPQLDFPVVNCIG